MKGKGKKIFICGALVVILAVVVITAIPDSAGAIPVSSVQDGQDVFTVSDDMVCMMTLSLQNICVPREVAADGEYLYVLGSQMKEGVGTGRTGIWKIKMPEDFVREETVQPGDAELLIWLENGGSKYAQLYVGLEELVWMETPGGVIWTLDPEHPKKGAAVKEKLRGEYSFAYENGTICWFDGLYDGADLWCISGPGNKKLMSDTVGSHHPPRMENQWIAALNGHRDVAYLMHCGGGEPKKLSTGGVKADGVYTNHRYTLMIDFDDRASVLCHDDASAELYLLDSCTGARLQDDCIWLLRDGALKVYHLEDMTCQQVMLDIGNLVDVETAPGDRLFLCDRKKMTVSVNKVMD